MEKYLDLDVHQLENLGGLYTAKEIEGQPALWLKLIDLFKKKENEIIEFLKICLPLTNRIVLTGAGTSAYIGLTLQATFQKKFGIVTQAVPTTDLVTHPEDCFSKKERILLISFARSGNSPESVAAVNLADQLCLECFHLIITCDEKGELANYSGNSQKLILVLPPESNDKSLAMTGSYSGMILAGLLVSRIKSLNEAFQQVKVVSKYGQRILSEYTGKLRSLSELNFQRAVFLGSGPFFGTATESHLKVQELTDGDIICKCETYLGFRHGPKAIVDSTTLVIYLFSNNAYAGLYEKDLVLAMSKGQKPLSQIAVCETAPENLTFDLCIQLSDMGKQIDEDMLAVCCILPGQILGFFKSINNGHKPDSPSDSGAISRVVEGVKIYEYTRKFNSVI
jgi:tagatose-6-phosphate ketose/aldose isomerase